jgi:hypothetical protein
MHSIAHDGLGVSIITSALGAFLLCLLVFRYGFSPADDESPEQRSRRQFVTRLGHAAGAVCFAITAGLAAVALGVSDRSSAEAPAALAAPSPELRVLRTENQRLGETVHTLGARLTEPEAALQRLHATSTETSKKIDRLDRGAATARVAPTPSARESRRPGVERLDSAPPAPRRFAPGVESRAPVLRPAAVSPATRPVSLPPVDAPSAAITPAPQATTTPDAPPVRTTAVAERAPTTVAVSAPAVEPDPIDSASRGVTRLGGTLTRGFLNIGKSIRRFVEDLQ